MNGLATCMSRGSWGIGTWPNLDTAGTFEDELRRVEATDAAEIVIDLGRLDWIDLVGLNTLIHAAARSNKRGGGLMRRLRRIGSGRAFAGRVRRTRKGNARYWT